MHDLSEFRIEVKGRLEEDNINIASPIHIILEKVDDMKSTFTVVADQSGMVGLIRFLHRQGYLIISICKQRSNQSD